MTHPYDIMPLEQGGGLIFTPCPGTKEVDLRSALQDLQAAGASAVITLMPSHELQDNNVAAPRSMGVEKCRVGRKRLEMLQFLVPQRP